MHITPGKRETLGYSLLGLTWLPGSDENASKPEKAHTSQTHGRLKKPSDTIAGASAGNPSATEACTFFRHAPGLELESEWTRSQDLVCWSSQF